MRLSGKITTKPASPLNVGSKLVIENDWVRKTILVEEIAVKRVCFEKAKAFYKIIEQDTNSRKFFQSRVKYKPNKRLEKFKGTKRKITLSFR